MSVPGISKQARRTPSADPAHPAAASVVATRRSVAGIAGTIETPAPSVGRVAPTTTRALWARSSYLMGNAYCGVNEFPKAISEYLHAGDECPPEELRAAAKACVETGFYAEAISAFVALGDGPQLIAVASAILVYGREAELTSTEQHLVRMALIEAAKLGM